MIADVSRRRIVKAAVERYGSMAALARHIGVFPQALHAWTVTIPVPMRHVAALAEATGLARHELRPDIYEAPQSMNPNGMLDREIIDALDEAALRAKERGEDRDIEKLILAAEDCVRMLRDREGEK